MKLWRYKCHRAAPGRCPARGRRHLVDGPATGCKGLVWYTRELTEYELARYGLELEEVEDDE